MNRLLTLIFAVLFIYSCTNVSNNKPTEQEATSSTLQKAEWLLGNWQNITDEAEATEIWTQQNDSTYNAISYIISEQDTIFYETAALQYGKDSTILSVSEKDNAGSTVHFKLTYKTDSSFVFENPNHDFPTKITYTKIGADSLYAEISGQINGKESKEAFPFKKAN